MKANSNDGPQTTSVYDMSAFSENILLYEYQLNPKEMRLIPLSIQYRTAVADGMLKVKIFIHANPKLPKKIFDIEISANFKEKEKLNLKSCDPHGIATNEGIVIKIANFEPDSKSLIQFEFT